MNVDAAKREGKAENVAPRRSAMESREQSVGLEMLLRVPDLNRVDSAERSPSGPEKTSESVPAEAGPEDVRAQAEAPQPPSTTTSAPVPHVSNSVDGTGEPVQVESAAPSDSASSDSVPSGTRSAWKARWNAVSVAATAIPGKVQALTSKVKLARLSGPVVGSSDRQASNSVPSRVSQAWKSHWKGLVAVAAAILLCTFVARAMKQERPDAEPQLLAHQPPDAERSDLTSAVQTASEQSAVQSVAADHRASAVGAPSVPDAARRHVDSANSTAGSPPIAQHRPSAFAGARRIDFEMQPPTRAQAPANHARTSQDFASASRDTQPRSSFADQSRNATAYPAERNSQHYGATGGAGNASAFAEETGRPTTVSQAGGGSYYDVASSNRGVPSPPTSVAPNYGDRTGRFGADASSHANTSQFAPERTQGPQGRTPWPQHGVPPSSRQELELNRPGQLPHPPGPAIEGSSPVNPQQLSTRHDATYPSTNPATYMYRPGDFQQIRTSLLDGPGHIRIGKSDQLGRPQTNPNSFNLKQSTEPSSNGAYR